MDAIRSAFRSVTDTVMNVPPEERLVREATTMDKWGPTAQQMKGICDLTFQPRSFLIVMNALITRLSEPGKYWRHVYKSLLVIDYALKNGSPEVVEYCRQHIIEIQTLQRYQHIDEENRDQGLNVRERAKLILELINDEKKLKEERKRAYACRDKYVGVSNDGSAAFRSAGYSSSGSSHYGSVSYDDPLAVSGVSDDADSRWGMSGDAAGDSSVPEPEPLPEEPAAPAAPVADKKSLFDTEFSEPVSAQPKTAQTGSLFDSLDVAPSTTATQPAASTTSFFDVPATTQPAASTTSFFDAPAPAPAPTRTTATTGSFFDMQPATTTPTRPVATSSTSMSFFDMAPAPAPAPAQPAAPVATSSTSMSFFDMAPAQPAPASSSSFFPTTTTTTTTQPAAPAKKDDIWGGLVNLDSLGSSSSSASPAKSGPMSGSTPTSPSKMSMSAMSSTGTTGPAMRPMSSSTMQPASTTMSFTSSSTTAMQPTRGPNYDALRQPQYNPYMTQQQQQQQQMLRMQQMQQQQRYMGSGF